MIFLFSNFVNIPTKFNNKEPVYNRLSSCGRNQLEMNQVVREIVTALDPIDEFLHHLDGAHVGISGKGEIDNGLDRNTVIHDIVLQSFHGDSFRVIVEHLAQFHFDAPEVVAPSVTSICPLRGRARRLPITFYDLILNCMNDSQNFHSSESNHFVYLRP